MVRFPSSPPTHCWSKAGEPGEIVQVGSHVETETPIYLVEFGERKVIGCFAEEIAPV